MNVVGGERERGELFVVPSWNVLGVPGEPRNVSCDIGAGVSLTSSTWRQFTADRLSVIAMWQELEPDP